MAAALLRQRLDLHPLARALPPFPPDLLSYSCHDGMLSFV